ncbi:unnamed protein product [Didymodactylos carnosus]|uniref:Uncharacterized protein n=1 Tax=Didymodactylos carnosus TaxID=1234261 RepID=A0A814D1F0_9BILA|nr:unnamed protein product [Didymodactylos carnosus]CAF3723273.1 unnamed protein product [Didymodactylos carnosus]
MTMSSIDTIKIETTRRIEVNEQMTTDLINQINEGEIMQSDKFHQQQYMIDQLNSSLLRIYSEPKMTNSSIDITKSESVVQEQIIKTLQSVTEEAVEHLEPKLTKKQEPRPFVQKPY